MTTQDGTIAPAPDGAEVALHPKMRSVNVLLTDEMIGKIEPISTESRSDAVRTVLAAILDAHADGISGPLNDAIIAARRTSARERKLKADRRICWRKSIIWIPEDLHDTLNAISARSETLEDRVRVADLIRGAIIFISETDPYGNIRG